MVTPTAMRMDMQMFHLMYAPTDDLTVMVMASHLRLSMDHLTRMGMRFTTEAAGFGDTKAEVLYTAAGDVRVRFRRGQAGLWRFQVMVE